MYILALETTAKTGTVAAAIDDRVVFERPLNPVQRSAQSLAPAIAEMLAELGWRPRDIRLVAVAVGPGSFTGLRVGVATAKVFAYAVGAEVIGLNALEAIAAAAPADVTQLETVIDAQRGDVIAQAFRRDEQGQMRPSGASRLVSHDDWLASLKTRAAVSGAVVTGTASCGPIVSGPGLEKLIGRLPDHVRVLPANLWHPQAAALARMAYRDYTAGRRDDLWALLPIYSRRAAAEEQWEKLGK